jgi:hypothetical protein
MVTHRLGAGLVSVFVLAAACASAQKLPVFGTWKVTSFATPGVSAHPSVPALSWVGVSASFASEDARFGADHCSSPKYTARTLSAAEFQQEYRVAAATLGISGEPITLYRLECGYNWGAKTNTLIVKSPTSLLTPLDGTFFELVKSPTNLK